MALLSNSEFVLDEKNRRNVSKYFITYYDKFGSVLLDRTFHREQTLNSDQHIYTPPSYITILQHPIENQHIFQRRKIKGTQKRI